jgi:hypothetical protein
MVPKNGILPTFFASYEVFNIGYPFVIRDGFSFATLRLSLLNQTLI